MAIITGPELDAIRDEARKWYAETRLWLIQQMEEGYPYRSIKLDDVELLQRYQQMQADPTQAAWQAFISRLEERYRGLPDQRRRVQDDIDAFARKMEGLKQRMAPPAVVTGQGHPLGEKVVLAHHDALRQSLTAATHGEVR